MKIRRISIFLFLLVGAINQAQDDPIKKVNNPLYALPDNMPLQTKLLWAENGLLRKTNLFQVDRPRELELRTKMLQLHQKLALGTLGLIFTQGYLGFQLQDATTNYMELSDRHAALGKVAFGSYLTSAMLSYTAPPAFRYNRKIDSIRIHRWLSIIHFTGMLALPYLGEKVSGPHDSIKSRDRALYIHRGIAVTTISTMALSALITFLPF
tara:strand:+ start:452 stop:1081 length:630 start_codon:yes stop_codon:yes gene_type:complete